jgi:SAM-dependent methyltransferase
VSEVWRGAEYRSAEFNATALRYDRHRPRYPQALFDDLVRVYRLEPGDRAVEIGAGTGIATLPLIECGFEVSAIEPAPAMAALLEAKAGRRAQVVVGRFEEATVETPVDLVAAFNSWHWIDPARGVEHLVEVLAPDGVVALVWTEVTSWGEEPFESRLADLMGGPWVAQAAEIVNSKDAIETDGRFTKLAHRRYRFDRRLDAHTFVEVTKTYGGRWADELLAEIEALINNEFGGAITKEEEAAVYAYRRL